MVKNTINSLLEAEKEAGNFLDSVDCSTGGSTQNEIDKELREYKKIAEKTVQMASNTIKTPEWGKSKERECSVEVEKEEEISV